ncbi:MAG: helix-turn-helix transcriptional regulator [Bacteroidales bacterium]|nr:helix-turn-helix transcriptional regulator [Bacteroidales bacterium]
MLQALIIFMPFAVCLFWVMMHALLASRTESFSSAAFFFLNLAIYMLVDSCYSWGSTNVHTMATFSLAAQFSGPCLIPLLMLYLGKLRTRKPSRSIQMVWMMLPAALLTSGLVLYILVGHNAFEAFISEFLNSGHLAAATFKGSAVYYYYLWDIIAYNAVMILEILFLSIYMIRQAFRRNFSAKHVWNFLFKNGKIAPIELQFVFISLTTILFIVKANLYRPWIISHQNYMVGFAVLEIVLVSLLAWTALFSSADRISMEDMFSAFLYNRRPGEMDRSPEPEQIRRVNTAGYIPHSLSAGIFSTIRTYPEDESLRENFEHLMQDEQLFLQPSLSLGDVAVRLRSSKTIISKMVNETYRIGFPELLNTLRVDYAQQYLLGHRRAKQDEIAKQCGFLSASSFNNTFKRICGVTPKLWLASFK